MKLSKKIAAILTAAVICCAAPLSVSADKRKTAEPVSTESSAAEPVSTESSAAETAAPAQKTSIDYSCTVEDVIAIKGLKSGQYTLSNNRLYYRSKYLDKDAVSCCYFYDGTLSFFLTAILKSDLPESELQSAYDTITDTYAKSLGEPMLSYEKILGNMWRAGENYVIAVHTGDAVVTMNLSKRYMDELISGNTILPRL